MTRIVNMPKYGLQQDEGTVVRWIKQIGDPVEKGELICEVETDKALFELESTETGYLRQIVAAEGEPVPVLTPIAVLTDTADEAIEKTTPVETGPQTTQEPEADRGVDGTPARRSVTGGRVPSSPAAKRRARELGVDLAETTGTGPGGRVIEKDVERMAAAGAIAGGRGEPMSRMRKAIAKAMVTAKQTIPHFYLDVDIDMTETEAWWRTHAADSDPALTLTDLIVKASAIALLECRALNASVDGDTVIYHDDVNIGLAVGTEEGLLVPVLAGAAAKSLPDLAAERKRAVDEARQGRMFGEARATFTVSNLGMFGIRSFSAIINPPETGSVAVGAVRDEVRPGTETGTFVARRVMTMTLSADHRVVDGLVAANYLKSVRTTLEDPWVIEAWMT